MTTTAETRLKREYGRYMDDLWSKVLHSIYSRKTLIMYKYSMHGLASSRLEPANGLVFRELRPEEWQGIEGVLATQRAAETVFQPVFNAREAYERLRSGGHCFVCEDKGSIVGYTWFAAGEKYITEIESTIRLKRRQVYAYNAYVARRYRGRNVFRNLLITGARALYPRGFTNGVASAIAWNRTSRAILHRAAFSEVGRVTVGYFLTLRYMTSTCRSISLERNAGPFELYKRLFGKLSGSLSRGASGIRFA